MSLFAYVLVFFAGVIVPLQALVNARLAHLTSGPVFASLLSFCVGTVALAAWWLATRPALPDFATLSRVPWWAWSGGLLGAIYVVVATLMVPRLGAASLICLIVFGQLLGSLLLDHYGVLHSPKPVDLTRVIGVVLVAIGALLVVRPWHPG